MRRRTPINVWPSLADLMTVLAVPALCTAVGLYPYYRNSGGYPTGGPPGVTPRNEEMYQAMERAQDVIDGIEAGLPKELGAIKKYDQSINFGDDLVDYEINGYVPLWRKDSRDRLEQYCRFVSQELRRKYGNTQEVKRSVTVLVEGHTDSTTCKGRPNCNWIISAGRAGAFVSFMKKENFCPGGANLDLRPLGFADTKLLQGEPTRRIALRLVPNYEKIIEEKEEKRGVP